MSLSCDGCAACCRLLSVEELDKPAGRWCPKVEHHEHGRRCGIYAERPGACRNFLCLWLASQSRPGQEMQPELRPDRSHVVFCSDVSVGGDSNLVLYAHVDPDWPNAWRAPLPRLAIRSFINRGGSVIVVIGKRRVLLRPGQPPLFTTEDALEVAMTAIKGMMRQGDSKLPQPTFDPDELLRRRA